MSSKPPVSTEEFTDMFESLAPASDRVRLAGLDHARRVQSGRIGATERRLALTRARRATDTATITRLEERVTTERRVDGAYLRSVTRAEIEVPDRKSPGAVVHGLVFAADGKPANALTVAAVSPQGNVERFTCTDARGFFRMDIDIAGRASAGELATTVFLQVSDADQAVLYRGDEAIKLDQSAVVYREIRLGGERLPPCPIPPDKATMPRLLDLPEVEALALLGRFGLDVAQRLTQSAPKRAGLVVSQEPPAGTPVTAATRVTLVIGVAEGGDTVTVPDVVGLTQDGAAAKLEEAKLAVGATSELPGKPVGTVLRQTPAAGARVAPGTAVALVIAAEPDQTTVVVPDLKGKSVEDANAILKEAGLETGRITFRDGEPAGIVLAQDPDAGKPVPPGTAVNLVVSRASDVQRIDTPNVVGRNLAGATEILASVKLKPGTITGVRTGTVARQDPAAGASIAVGGSVALQLTGRDPRVDGGVQFTDDLTRRVAEDAGFSKLGLSTASVQKSLTEAKVTDEQSVERVIEMDNRQLARTFGLRNLNHARSLRRMLREALARR